MARKPSVNASPVANQYVSRDERIVEFTNGDKGGLVSFRNTDAGLRVEVYNCDPGVTVVTNAEQIVTGDPVVDTDLAVLAALLVRARDLLLPLTRPTTAERAAILRDICKALGDHPTG